MNGNAFIEDLRHANNFILSNQIQENSVIPCPVTLK